MNALKAAKRVGLDLLCMLGLVVLMIVGPVGYVIYCLWSIVQDYRHPPRRRVLERKLP